MAEKEIAQYEEALLKLIAANKAFSEIISCISETVFTINKNRIINAEFSPSMYSLVDILALENGRFPEIFGFDEAMANSVQEWIDVLATRLDIGMSDLIALAPITEMKLGKGGASEKYFSVSYSGLFDDDGLKKVVVSMRDITKEKLLTKEVEDVKKTHEDAMEQIANIIKLDADTFDAYILECKKTIAETKTMVEALSGGPCSADIVGSVLRSVHTLKGNSRAFGFTHLGEIAHGVEDSLCFMRDNPQQLTSEFIDGVKSKINALDAKVAFILELCKTILHGKDLGKARTGSRDVFVRVKLDKILHLAHSVNMLCSQVREKKSDLGEISETIYQAVSNLRHCPVNKLFSRFPKMVNDLAITLKKKCEIALYGGEMEIDVDLLEKLGNATVHLVRNAVDHGVETPEERIIAGKSEIAHIRLQISKVGVRLHLEIADDGRGINKEHVCARALATGLISDDDAGRMSDQEIFALICKPGFTTAASVSDISGRGVGMDVVATTMAELKGSLEIESTIGKGTIFRLIFPDQSLQKDLYSVDFDENALTIVLNGIITQMALNELRMLTTDAAHGNVGKIVMDVTRMTILSSEFIGFIVSLHLLLKEKDKKLIIINDNPTHAEILTGAYINEIVEIRKKI